jgi:hypothetical protein
MKMRFFLKFGLFFFVIVIASSVFFPMSYGMDFPRDPGPVLDNTVRANHLKYIEENRPQLVMIGDSTLGDDVDPDVLAEESDKSVYRISIPGSASALWYLVLKSNIVPAVQKPEYVLIFFRDTILTAPGYRVHGSYFDLMDEYADHNEPLVMQNSFVNLMNPLEIAAEKNFPLYVFRSDIRSGIDTGLRYFTPSLLGCDKDCTDEALSEMFQAAGLEPGALVDAVGAAESYLYTPDQLDFEGQVNNSYLPEIIRMTKENNIKLILVRIKVETHPPDPKVDEYILSLKDYLQKNGVVLLDYGKDPRITPDFFSDSLHFLPAGRDAFTPMLAEDLNKIFAEK